MQIVNLKTTSETNLISTAIRYLNQGNLIIYPTETCYGIGADATNPKAITKLLQFKGNRQGKAISIAVSNQAMAEQYVELNSTARNLYQNFLPGPITVISQNKGLVAKALESERHTLGIRLPDYPLILKLIKAFGKPITATSANASGYKQPYSLQDFQRYNPKKSQQLVSLFLDAGRLPQHLPSTVVDTTLNDTQLVRQGSIVLKNVPTYTSNLPQKTITIARKIITPHLSLLKTYPIIVALQGNLGAGKTHFVKGIAQTLNINDVIKSPTYNLIHEHKIPFTVHRSPFADNENQKQSTANGEQQTTNYLYHLDTWRLPNGNELFTTLNFNRMLKPGNLIAIEWLEKIKPQLDQLNKHYPILWIDIKTTSPTTRKISYRFSPPILQGRSL